MESNKFQLNKLNGFQKMLLPGMVCKDWKTNNLYVHTIDRPVHVTVRRSDGYVYDDVYSKSPSKIIANSFDLLHNNCAARKRYKTTVFLKPEMGHFQKKPKPYRYVETMITQIGEKTNTYISEKSIDRKMDPKDHYIGLESQQIDATRFSNATEHITIDHNHNHNCI